MRRRIVIAALFGAACAASAQAERASEPGAIPFRKGSTPAGFDGSRWAAAVLTALAVGAGLLWWLRRRLPGATAGSRGRRIKLVETIRVSPRTTLLLVEVDGKTLLVGEPSGAIVLLSPAGGERPHA